jgi:hypothetical protein
MPPMTPPAAPPTSSRTFDSGRVQDVTSQRNPIYSNYGLPELDMLRRLKGPQMQAQALEQPASDVRSAASQEPEFTYEGTFGQADPHGGYTHYEPGMGVGINTPIVATGWQRVRNPNYRGPSSGGRG